VGVSAASSEAVRPTPSLEWVIFASSGGTLIEWYDFYLYQTMAVYFADTFFPASTHHGMLGLLLSMATLGLGFAVRPLGGLLFGSLGDRVGRKYTFMLTLLMMGSTTTLMGVLPTFAEVGYVAPLLLILLRLVQGLAAGGEIGGAATYVAEYAPQHRRGWYTGIINTMSPLGSLVSLVVVYACRTNMGPAVFNTWGWRLPFLFSALLVAVSLYLRLRLRETPVFELLRQHHHASRSPVRELFLNRDNRFRLFIGIFGATAGQSAIGITAMAFSLSFMQAVLKIDLANASAAFFVGVVCGLPFFLLSGWLSDKIGRRPQIIGGACCALVLFVPIYHGMKYASSPVNFPLLAFLNWAQVVTHAIILGPILAFLAELFPARVRTTGLTVSYNVSNGFLNGFAPLIAFSLIAATGNIYFGLAYQLVLALITALVNIFFVKETYRTDFRAEVAGESG